MKKFIIFLCTFLPFSLFAQVETSLNIGGGLAFYHGYSNASHPEIQLEANPHLSIYFDSRPGLSFNISAEMKKVTDYYLIYGCGFGYDYSRSVLIITGLRDSFYDQRPVENGRAIFSSNNIFIKPYVGERIKIKNMHLDVCLGVEIAKPFFVKTQGSINLDFGDDIIIMDNRELSVLDFRPSISINSFYKNTGIFISYSHGISNYQETSPLEFPEIYSRLFRFGFSYRFVTN